MIQLDAFLHVGCMTEACPPALDYSGGLLPCEMQMLRGQQVPDYIGKSKIQYITASQQQSLRWWCGYLNSKAVQPKYPSGHPHANHLAT